MSADRDRVGLSLVVPVHDERENLEALVEEVNEVLLPAADGIEIVLVDDGSTDGSWETIAALARHHPHVRGIHLRARRGQTAAFDAGFRAARGRCVVTMDGDLQNDPRDVAKLVAALDHHDVAVGYRTVCRDPWSRRAAARVANAVRNRLTGDQIVDTGCSLKAFRAECLGRLKLHRGLHRFLPTLLRMEGCRVVQLPVRHRARRAGRSKYGILDRLLVSIADLLAVRWMQRRRLDYEIDRRVPE